MKKAFATLASIVIVSAAIFGWWAWCPVSKVAMPPSTATPRQVVATYIEALDHHDCVTASNLWAPHAREIGAHWCHNVRSISVKFPQGAGGTTGDKTAGFSTVLTYVPRLNSDDHTLPPLLPFDWDFYLARRDEGWRIVMDGQG